MKSYWLAVNKLIFDKAVRSVKAYVGYAKTA